MEGRTEVGAGYLPTAVIVSAPRSTIGSLSRGRRSWRIRLRSRRGTVRSTAAYGDNGARCLRARQNSGGCLSAADDRGDATTSASRERRQFVADHSAAGARQVLGIDTPSVSVMRGLRLGAHTPRDIHGLTCSALGGVYRARVTQLRTACSERYRPSCNSRRRCPGRATADACSNGVPCATRGRS